MDKEIGNLTRLQKMKKGLIQWNGGELMLSVVLRNLDIYLCPSTKLYITMVAFGDFCP